MRIAILYTPAAKDAPPEELDGLIQLEAVSRALESLGHEPIPIAFELNVQSVQEILLFEEPDLVFNLVEAVAGQDRLLYFAPALLESMGMRFTGASLMSTLLSTNKLQAKRMMQSARIPTPAWIEPTGSSPCLPRKNQRVIIKSAWDHGSMALDDDAVRDYTRPEDIVPFLRDISQKPGQLWFAEQYIHGREFNLSLMETPTGPIVLPPAEILFNNFGCKKPHIVGYRAKWEVKSFEYINTPRTFDFIASDIDLLEKLSALAIACWHLFDLSGFARVDFRVDQKGKPWVLEVNVNPCLSPDAGFAAAATKANISYHQAIETIISNT